VEVIAPAGASDIIGCDRYRGTIAQVEPWSTYATKEKAFHIRSIDCWFRASSLRKLSEAEIAAHLAAEEAKRKEAERAEKVKALKFGVRVMTPDGEGVYWKKGIIGFVVIYPTGKTRPFTIDDITILP
jgi:sugar/nucleoside kinase (ribokinase family)